MTTPKQKEFAPPPTPKVNDVTLAHKEAQKNQQVRIGYEYGCPGSDEHLALRFKGRPVTAFDGTELSILSVGTAIFNFLRTTAPLEVIGIQDSRLKGPIPREASKAPQLLDDISDALSKAQAVNAQWFVVHDTGGGGSYTAKSIPSKARGAHMFINRKNTEGVVLLHDYAEAGSATKFEMKAHHPEFRGQMLHFELVGTHALWNKVDSYTEYQLSTLVWAYIFASIRAKKFLTVTGHREVDRGIPDGHSDPRGFDYEFFYKSICDALLLNGKTFGLLNDRGAVFNDKAAINTFPMQYGKIETEKAKDVTRTKDQTSNKPSK